MHLPSGLPEKWIPRQKKCPKGRRQYWLEPHPSGKDPLIDKNPEPKRCCVCVSARPTARHFHLNSRLSWRERFGLLPRTVLREMSPLGTKGSTRKIPSCFSVGFGCFPVPYSTSNGGLSVE